jgi:putrescine transport system permease protein
MNRLHRLLNRRLVIAAPYLWLLVFFLVPFAIVLKIALAEPLIAQPPYTALVETVDRLTWRINLTLQNFAFLLEDDLYWRAYLNSLKIAALSTLGCLLLGYPMAYGIVRAPRSWRMPLLFLVILPFWTSFLIRVYAWKVILQGNGAINALLLALGLIEQPLPLLYNEGAVYLGIIYSYLPFMVLPLYANLERLDPRLLEAAADLGARPFAAFRRVTLPLSLPGIVAGSLLVFIPAVGEFVIPELLGGPDSLMIGRVLWDEFFANRDWPVAAAVAIALLLLLVVPIMLFQAVGQRTAEAAR